MARDRRGQRGVALAVVAIGLTVMLGFCVLAVELGHLGVSTSEVQIVADSAATAAARSLLRNKLTGGLEAPLAAAATVAAENTVDGQPLSRARVVVTEGVFSPATGSFTATSFSPNAARAVARATLPSGLAAILGQRPSRVRRTAIAAYGGTCTAQTALPIALGSCLFRRYQRRQNCSRLPSLANVPDAANNSCWTSLEPGSADASQASSFLPSECCSGRSCGGGQPVQLQTGSQINGLTGQDDVLLGIIRNCYDQGIREFVVPVINCGSNPGGGNGCGQSQVVGFATVRVDSVTPSGPNEGMNLTTLCSDDDPGGGIGCSNYGRQTVALVR